MLAIKDSLSEMDCNMQELEQGAKAHNLRGNATVGTGIADIIEHHFERLCVKDCPSTSTADSRFLNTSSAVVQ